MSDNWRSYRQGKHGRSNISGTKLAQWCRGRSHALLSQAFDLSKHGNAGKMSAGAVLLLLIVGAIAFISHLGGTSNHSAREQTAIPPQTIAHSNAGPPIAKPPAGHPLGAPQAPPYTVLPNAGTPQSGTPRRSAGAAPSRPESEPAPASPSSPAGSYRFTATHKQFGGGCEGRLVLSNEGLHFSCPGQPDINVRLTEIDRLDKDGVRLVSGKKYHFKISDDRKAKVESIFASWLNKARQNRPAYGYTSSITPAN